MSRRHHFFFTSFSPSPVSITALGNIAPPLAALVTAPLLAHTLGVETRGNLAAATAPMLLATAAGTLGLPESLTYHLASSSVRPRRALAWTMSLSVISGIAAAALIYASRDWLSNGNHIVSTELLLATTCLIPALLVGVLRAAAAGSGQWARITGEKFIGSILKVLLITLLMIRGDLSLRTACLTIAITPVMGGLAYVGMKVMTTPIHDAPIKNFVGYAMLVWSGSVSGILLFRLDQAILGPLSSAYELGLYAVAVVMGEVPMIVSSAFRDVIFVTDANDQDDGSVARAARRSFLASALVAVSMAAVCPFLIPLLFGQDFSEAKNAATILLAAVVIGTPGSVAGAALGARGRPHLRSLALFIACFFNIGILIGLAPTLGAFGAALSTLGGSAVAGVLNIWLFCRVTNATMISFVGIRLSDLESISFKKLQKEREDAPLRN